MATLPKPKVAYCLNCHRQLPFDSFYKSKAHFTDLGEVVPYCTNCTEEIFSYYLKKCGNLKSAVFFTCQKLDLPFVEKAFKATEKMLKQYQKTSKEPKKADQYTFFKWYYNFVYGVSSVLTPTDLKNEFADSDGIKFDDVTIKENEAIEQQILEYKLIWGSQETLEDYQFLSYVFEKYTKGMAFENAQQEDLYRDLCLARLEKRKIEEMRSDEDITKVQSRILTLMKVLKVDDFTSAKPKSLAEQFLSNKITMIDENNVSDIYSSPCEMKDFNKIQRYYKDMCLRPLSNMLCNNKDFDLNLEDIEKYNMDED